MLFSNNTVQLKSFAYDMCNMEKGNPARLGSFSSASSRDYFSCLDTEESGTYCSALSSIETLTEGGGLDGGGDVSNCSSSRSLLEAEGASEPEGKLLEAQESNHLTGSREEKLIQKEINRHKPKKSNQSEMFKRKRKTKSKSVEDPDVDTAKVNEPAQEDSNSSRQNLPPESRSRPRLQTFSPFKSRNPQVLDHLGDKHNTSSNRSTMRTMWAISLVSVIAFTLSDVFLHFGHGDGDLRSSDRWFALLLRAGIQLLVGLTVSLGMRKPPWGNLKSLGISFVICLFSGILVFILDSASRRTPIMLEVTFQFFAPVVTLMFALTLCLEKFSIHRVISITCIGVSSVLLSQPQIFGGESIKDPSVFNFDLVFSTPVSTKDLPENIYSQCLNQTRPLGQSPICSVDIMGLIYIIMLPIISAYVVILVHIDDGRQVGAVLLWQGLGFLSATIYGIMDTSSFSLLNPNLSLFSIVMLVLSAVFGVTGTALLVISIQRSSPTKAIIMRWLQIVLILIVQCSLDGRYPKVSGVVGCVLIGIAVSEVTLEQLFG